jgi:hypothetical protein
MNNRNKYCGRHTLVGELFDNKTGKLSWGYLRSDCQTYSCGYCGERKARKVRKAITQKAVDLKLQRMLTLTLDPRKVSSKDSIQHIRKTWSKFRVYLKRKYKTQVTFIAVLELQKSGMAHLHVLVDRFIPHAWISESWESIGGGKIVHVQFVDIHRVAVYLTKYLTKEMLINLPGKTKRYTTSRNICLFSKKERAARWMLFRIPIQLAHMLAAPSVFDETFDNENQLRFFKCNDPPHWKIAES